MKIRLVGSSAGELVGHHFLTSFLVDEQIAIDAGSIGCIAPIKLQRKIKHVFLSHSHLDHIASLPNFLDNVFADGSDCPTVYGNESVRRCLEKDIFNDRVWPDLVRLSSDDARFLKFVTLNGEQPVHVGEHTITPVLVNHVVPTFGFVIEANRSAVVIVSDTAPTDRIWEIANKTPNLKAVILEASFPNSMQWLAEKSAHLTPALFADEIRKLQRDVRVLAIHLKPAFHGEIVDQLENCGIKNLEIAEPSTDYHF